MGPYKCSKLLIDENYIVCKLADKTSWLVNHKVTLCLTLPGYKNVIFVRKKKILHLIHGKKSYIWWQAQMFVLEIGKRQLQENNTKLIWCQGFSI